MLGLYREHHWEEWALVKGRVVKVNTYKHDQNLPFLLVCSFLKRHFICIILCEASMGKGNHHFVKGETE